MRIMRAIAGPPAAFVTGVVAVLGSLLAGAAYLAANDWFGAGDLAALLVWSLPLGVLVAVSMHPLVKRAPAQRGWKAYSMSVVVGAGVGFAWSIAAALALGPWIGAFSLPVQVCWMAGGTAAGIATGWLGSPGSGRTALALGALLVVAVARVHAHALAPEPTVRVLVRPGASPDEVSRVWSTVLGRLTGREGHPEEHALLAEIAGVSASGYVGDTAILTVTFWKGIRDRQRDSVIALIGESPLVARVDTLSAKTTRGRRSVGR